MYCLDVFVCNIVVSHCLCVLSVHFKLYSSYSSNSKYVDLSLDNIRVLQENKRAKEEAEEELNKATEELAKLKRQLEEPPSKRKLSPQ